jgi:hypothetical protein
MAHIFAKSLQGAQQTAHLPPPAGGAHT